MKKQKNQTIKNHITTLRVAFLYPSLVTRYFQSLLDKVASLVVALLSASVVRCNPTDCIKA